MNYHLKFTNLSCQAKESLSSCSKEEEVSFDVVSSSFGTIPQSVEGEVKAPQTTLSLSSPKGGN